MADEIQAPPPRIPAQLLHETWGDMSDWLVHFTDSKQKMASILGSRHIDASGPFGRAKNFTAIASSQTAACLSEIPLDHLTRLHHQHGSWGIGFRKDFVTKAGGGRVWHVQMHSEIDRALFDLYNEKMSDKVSGFWQLTPFMDTLGPTYNFDWEREWRVPGGLAFEAHDIGLVISPVLGDPDLIEVSLWHDDLFDDLAAIGATVHE